MGTLKFMDIQDEYRYRVLKAKGKVPIKNSYDLFKQKLSCTALLDVMCFNRNWDLKEMDEEMVQRIENAAIELKDEVIINAK